MAESKKNQDRKQKQEDFKEQATPNPAVKTHLVPETEWETKDNLDLRGDLMEAFESTMVKAYQSLAETTQHFNQLGQIFHIVLQTNIAANKVRVNYRWNTGEAATEAEVNEAKAQLQLIENARKEQEEQSKIEENALKTGLVGTDGEPIGTTQDLTSLEGAEITQAD